MEGGQRDVPAVESISSEDGARMAGGVGDLWSEYEHEPGRGVTVVGMSATVVT